MSVCVVSLVMDGFSPLIPQPSPWREIPPQVTPYVPATTPWFPPMPPTDLAALLKAFHEAVAAAKTADTLTGQKDCADPEKVKLEDRVAELERRIVALTPRAKKKPAKKRRGVRP